MDAGTTLDAISKARRERHDVERIPKSVRSTFAKSLACKIDDAFLNGDDISWSKQLSFASVVLGVSSRDHDSSTSLASIIRRNLLKFDTSHPTWTISSPTVAHVSNMSPTQSRRSLVHEKLSFGDVSAAICVIASDDIILDVTPEVLRAPADADFVPFQPDINVFSAIENDVAKVLRLIAVGSRCGIDGLRLAQLRDVT